MCVYCTFVLQNMQSNSLKDKLHRRYDTQSVYASLEIFWDSELCYGMCVLDINSPGKKTLFEIVTLCIVEKTIQWGNRMVEQINVIGLFDQ